MCSSHVKLSFLQSTNEVHLPSILTKKMVCPHHALPLFYDYACRMTYHVISIHAS